MKKSQLRSLVKEVIAEPLPTNINSIRAERKKFADKLSLFVKNKISGGDANTLHEFVRQEIEKELAQGRWTNSVADLGHWS